MNSPPSAGTKDGETTEYEGRQWEWSTEMTAWKPLAPRNFEVVRGSDGRRWTYYKGSGKWVPPGQTPRLSGLGGGMKNRVLVRDSDTDTDTDTDTDDDSREDS